MLMASWKKLAGIAILSSYLGLAEAKDPEQLHPKVKDFLSLIKKKGKGLESRFWNPCTEGHVKTLIVDDTSYARHPLYVCELEDAERHLVYQLRYIDHSKTKNSSSDVPDGRIDALDELELCVRHPDKTSFESLFRSFAASSYLSRILDQKRPYSDSETLYTGGEGDEEYEQQFGTLNRALVLLKTVKSCPPLD